MESRPGIREAYAMECVHLHASRFAPYVKTVREGVKSAANSWVNGEVDPKAFVPASDAVYFSLLEQEAEVEPKDLLSQSSQITGVAKNAAAGAHLIKELSKFEEAQNAKKSKNDRPHRSAAFPQLGVR